MVRARNQKSTDLLELQSGISFWWTLFRIAAIVSAAIGVLTIDKEGHLIQWNDFFKSILDSFGEVIDRFISPIESGINWLLSKLGWNIQLQSPFKAFAFVGIAIGAATLRHVHSAAQAIWNGGIFITLGIFFGLSGFINAGSEEYQALQELAFVSLLLSVWGAVWFAVGKLFKQPNASGVGIDCMAILIVALAIVGANSLKSFPS